MNKNITAVIPVKENSSRLRGKNFLPINGFETLLENKISQLKRVRGIKEILITSDSDRAKEIALKSGVKFIKRPKEFADESRPLSDFFKYVYSLLETPYMMWACVTSPLVDSHDYEDAIQLFDNHVINGSNDSLITVSNFQHYLMDSNGPLNYSLGILHKNSDSLEKLHLFTNGILICSVEDLFKWGYNYGPNAFRMLLPQEKSIDIDTKWDYLTAKAWIEETKK